MDVTQKRKAQNKLFELVKSTEGIQSVVSRHLTETEVELFIHEKETPISVDAWGLPEELGCYPCRKCITTSHPVYVFSCVDCGNTFQELRHVERDLSDHVALVTGGRIKLGHQIVLKLIRAGATVIVTTRSPKKALDSFSKYPDYEEWGERLAIYPNGLDLDSDDIVAEVKKLTDFVEEEFGHLDILVNCAAQTIRCREKDKPVLGPEDETNRYSEPKFVKETNVNSWQMKLEDINQKEMEEVYRVNAIAPCLLIQGLMTVMKKSKIHPYIINVNSREGLFDVGNKSRKHIHLNMAKSAMAQMHRTLVDCRPVTESGKRFRIHACDPGWISIDEYYESDKPWPVPPLDEIDGAARILYPLWMEKKSKRKTSRHFGKVYCY